jgi:ABC-2 type transport system permease protein
VIPLADLYLAEFRTSLATMIQYRAALIIWLLGQVLDPVIYLIVWSTVSTSSGGSVGGYTTGDFAAYFLVLMVVNNLTYTWIMWEYEYRVREGSLSTALLRPVHPIHADVPEPVVQSDEQCSRADGGLA